MSKRILWLTPVPFQGAGSRYRIYQFLPALREAGIECDVRPFFDARFFKVVYQRGKLAQKTWYFLLASLKRLLDTIRLHRYDAVVVYRETFPIGGALIERIVKAAGLQLIYDLDDAVYLRDPQSVNPWVLRMRRPERVWEIVERSDLVICGSQYLASRCGDRSANIVVVPTSVDLDMYKPKDSVAGQGCAPVLGWVGSHSSGIYLDLMKRPLEKLAGTRKFQVRVVGASRALDWAGVDLKTEPWRLDQEVEYFRECDIGFYPIRDDSWGRGKCAFKAIQFMAVGVPVVASAVGANLELIRDGKNGFLASTEAEWEEKLGLLIDDVDLRRRLGAAARETVRNHYSLTVNRPKLRSALAAALRMDPRECS